MACTDVDPAASAGYDRAVPTPQIAQGNDRDPIDRYRCPSVSSPAPSVGTLQHLLDVTVLRVLRCLERDGLLIRDPEQPWLDLVVPLHHPTGPGAGTAEYQQGR